MYIKKFGFSFLFLLAAIIRHADSQPLPEKTIPVHEIVTGSHFPDIVKLTRIVVDDVRKRAYFASSLSRYIGVINTETLEMTSTIDTRIDGFVSRMLFLNPGTGVLYMFIIEQNLLYRIDPANGLVSSPISVHRAPAFDTVTNNLYISEAPDKIRIYNHQLQQINEINGVTAAGEIFINSSERKLYVVHSLMQPQAGVSEYDIATKQLMRKYNMPVGFDGLPKGIHVSGNKIYVNGNTIKHSISIIDTSTGNGVFIPISENGLQMETYGGRLYQMTGYPYYTGYLLNESGSYGILEVRDALTGNKITDLRTDLECLYFDIDQTNGRLFYTSTGRGIVGVINLADYTTIKKIDVATTMEDILVSPIDGSLYLRNRLGGSTIYHINPMNDVLISTSIPGNWPTKILLDEKHNRLYALSHYEAKVSVVDITSDMKVMDISLGTQKARTDALSTMAMDQSIGKLYVVIPELGKLMMVNADGSGNSTSIGVEGFTPNTSGGGPGKLHIAVNESLHRLYLFYTDAKRLNIYDGNTLSLLSYSTISDYNIQVPPLDLLYSDDKSMKLFVGQHIVDPNTGAVLGRIANGQKVITISPSGKHYVWDFIAQGFHERIYEFDSTFQSVLRQWNLSRINGVYSTLGFDFIRKKMYAGYFDSGELDVFNLDGSTDIENYNASSPKTFLLYQNYPNPYSARTTIRFRITDFGLGTQIARGVHEVPFGLRTNLKSHICLKVFDLLGREVATLVNAEVENGAHEIVFNASHLPVDLYYYTLTSQNFSQSRLMQVLR